MGKIKFVAMLYVMALASLFLGGSALFVKVRFKLASEQGIMTSSDPNVIRAAKYAPNNAMQADVVYATSTGPLAVHNKRLSAEDVQQLARGEGLPLTFMRSDPDWARNDDGAGLDSGIGWLLFGSVCSVVGVYAHRLLRRESAATH